MAFSLIKQKSHTAFHGGCYGRWPHKETNITRDEWITTCLKDDKSTAHLSVILTYSLIKQDSMNNRPKEN